MCHTEKVQPPSKSHSKTNFQRHPEVFISMLLPTQNKKEKKKHTSFLVAEARPPNLVVVQPTGRWQLLVPSCMYFSGPRSVRFHFTQLLAFFFGIAPLIWPSSWYRLPIFDPVPGSPKKKTAAQPHGLFKFKHNLVGGWINPSEKKWL